jgi:hypothetical protein
MGIFKKWLNQNEMAVRQINQFGEPIPYLPGKDDVGFPLMSRPGFREQDRKLLVRDEPEVEKKLMAATEQYGIHWLIGYLEPTKDMKEDDPADWERYSALAKERMSRELHQWQKEEKEKKIIIPPPSPENVIVYVKPTSRVHTLNVHEQIHNIGHAIWLTNPNQLAKAKIEIQKAVDVLQKSAYEADPNSPQPTEAEITVMIARLIDLLAVQRVLTLRPGDLESRSKTVLTGFNSYNEVYFDLLPAFVNAGGRLNLYPRGVGKIAKYDRTQAIPPNPEVVAKKQVRPYVWEKMASDKAAWMEVSKIMTKIILECLYASTWAKKGEPIYPYQTLTTKP